MDIKIFIINLLDSTDRKESMTKKIKEIDDFNIYINEDRVKFVESKTGYDKFNSVESNNLYFYFFPATSAYKIRNKEIEILNYDSFRARIIKGKDLSFGEIACFHSHYSLWHKALELDSPIIVLEDDIEFSYNFKEIINIYNSNFEYVRLMYLFDKKTIKLRDNFFISFEKVSGAQGYYITPIAAKKLIKNAKYFFHCVDDYMDMFFLHNVLNIIYKPFLISDTGAENSTIKDRNKEKVNKIGREISRIYLFVFRKYLFLLFNFLRIARLRNA
ncbi:glycosyltransferase family 25 protein [Helicobacter sp. MIT 14-3879]|uniref:glycosyltransferase family 25 protein n=1 Tax=Helicobacter sp. MIT 14-3879 TaxID=2040649 RepID=UPI000E1F01B9|nr:glycosyltransferase family 25 protein [Helicobacter sp. MIT 14-3879]RDU64015.1 lipooligosaccharide biosynthesis glycosyltransferase [Helicobacter sp. MIT 14-3879]